MKKIAVFPGSFDPITLGHVSVIKRAIPLFDEIIVAIGNNAEKKYMFDLKQRETWIKGAFKKESKISVDIYHGLTVDYCEKKQSKYILRGLRNQQDFEFERTIAQMNKKLNDEIETIFLFTEVEYSAINSTVVRDIIRNGGDAHQFLPSNIQIK
ncbi:MAG: pantetheine-phosphate adenylyltransferase [Flavobacteriales bacterium]|nr:pantetheine-phosphate adenylyltransferase [Flavobacteriales bacterium]